MKTDTPASPRLIIPLIASLQFVYILDFMLPQPLGPDLAAALGFPASRLSWLMAVYTLASMLIGVASVRWLDRFDRRLALLASFGAFSLITLLTPLAQGFYSLLTARLLTGLCGGPAVALGLSIVIDATPPTERGRAMGKVMMGFPLAAIMGVPFSLELARWGGWQAPFLVVATLAAFVWLAAVLILPSLRQHLGEAPPPSPLSLLSRPAVRTACLLQAASQFAAFLVIPTFAAYFLLNLGLPREQLSLFYGAGGIAALVVMQLAGRTTDKLGPLPAAIAGLMAFAVGLVPFLGVTSLPLVLPFILFMGGNAGRNISLATTTSQVPSAGERAGFMSLQSTVQDFGITLAALVSGLLVGSNTEGQLTGMTNLAILAIGVATLVVLGLPSLGRMTKT